MNNGDIYVFDNIEQVYNYYMCIEHGCSEEEKNEYVSEIKTSNN